MSRASLVISNVPCFAVLSDTGVVEKVTNEHIFDTVFLIDRSVRRVTSLRDDCYEVVCDELVRVKEALDGKKIGDNIISVKIQEKEAPMYLQAIVLFLLFLWGFSLVNIELQLPSRSTHPVVETVVRSCLNTSMFE